LISFCWSVFTLLGVFLFKQVRDPDYKIERLIAEGIWILHAVFVGLSIRFWITERESVLMVENDEEEGIE
jgi:hypothetical protein